MAVEDHKQFAPAPAAVRVFVITTSDSRDADSNEGGRLVRRLAEEAGFSVSGELLLPDERDQIRAAVARVARDGEADAILITGGTGLAGRDATIEAVSGLLEKRIDGYGELFRMLSFAEIGPSAMLSRALGGTIGRVALFAMPGSPAGVRLAMERLILPELPHVVSELQRAAGGARADGGHHHHGHHH